MNLFGLTGSVMIGLCTMASAGCEDDVTALAGPMIGSIVLQLDADTLSVGDTTELLVTIVSTDGDTLTPEGITFLSSDESIVTMQPTGDAEVVLVTAEGSGTAMITAEAGARTAGITIYVRRASSIEVTPADTTLVVDDTLSLTAIVRRADGAPIADAVVRWIEEIDVAAVTGLFDNEGLAAEFLATGVGREAITAETEGLTFTVNVTVDPSEVGSVLLSPDTLKVAVGDTARLTVVVRDTTGAVIADPQVVIFCGFGGEGACVTGNDFLIATYDATGLFTGGPSEGTVEIIARSRGVNSNTVHITVGS
jgi:uncharacterized protein YjdB